jgi:DEAD/DEAH box helicase domain-containing protein
VDIGGLDATVLCGFPGTIASMWQQIGRAGRSQQESLAVLVAGDDQLDQWFVNHPNELFERPPEPVVVNVDNPHILDPHLGCAAYERPLEPVDERWWSSLDDAVHRNVIGDQLRVRPDRMQTPRAVWDGRGMPFHKISLRSASSGEVRIVHDLDGGETLIGTVEAARAANLVHPGAVYLHRGQPWKVLDLDLDLRTALVEPDDGDTYSQARTEIDIDVLETAEAKPVGISTLHLGRVRVTTSVTGYQIKEIGTRAVVSSDDLDLPPQILETTAIWYDWTFEQTEAAGIRPFALPGALHAAEHAAIGILPLFTICDRWDVGGVSIAAAPQSGLPSVFIYDGYPGGAGIAELAYDAADRHLAATAQVLDDCPCTTGCPSCVQSPKCGNGNEPLDKMAALALLRATLGAEEPF